MKAYLAYLDLVYQYTRGMQVAATMSQAGPFSSCQCYACHSQGTMLYARSW
jgi:hypothetical protein